MTFGGHQTACQLPHGHSGVCRDLSGNALTLFEIPPDLRERFTAEAHATWSVRKSPYD